TAPSGARIPLAELVHQRARQGQGNIRHYNFRRAITVEADIDKALTDTVTANDDVRAAWETLRRDYPGVDLDFRANWTTFRKHGRHPGAVSFGMGLIYLILGTQFKSYFQPLMILATVPLAFTGVVLGLLITGNPLSLYTMYGVVALAGIAVNSAIVLISAANDRLAPLSEDVRTSQSLRPKLTALNAQQNLQADVLTGLRAQQVLALQAAEEANAKLQLFLAKQPERNKKLAQATGLTATQDQCSTQFKKLALEKAKLDSKIKATDAEHQLFINQLAVASQSQQALSAALSTWEPHITLKENCQNWASALLELQISRGLQAQLWQNTIDYLGEISSLRRQEDRAQQYTQATAAAAQKLEEVTLGANAKAKEVALARETLEQLRQSQALDALRLQLSPGKPCPVCGADHHPILAHWHPPSSEALLRAAKALAQAEKTEQAAQQLLQSSQTNYALCQAKAEQETLNSRTAAEKLARRFPEPFELPEKFEHAAELQQALTQWQEWDKVAQNYLKRIHELTQQQEQLPALRIQAEKSKILLSEYQAQAQKLNEETTTLALEQEKLAAELKALLGPLSLAEAQRQLVKAEQKWRNNNQEAQNTLVNTNLGLAKGEEKLRSVELALTALEQEANALSASLLPQLRELGFNDLNEAEQTLLSPMALQQLRDSTAQIDQEIHSLAQRQTTLLQEKEDLLLILAPLPSAEQLESELTTLVQTEQERQQTIGALQENCGPTPKPRPKPFLWSKKKPNALKNTSAGHNSMI
ncbi:MAG: hypothetical protein HC821_04750, partial [Lewinella sp.]|nr:hypothetical protein [Lewinella sp.]